MVEELNLEIEQMSMNLMEEAKAIAELPPVSYQSKYRHLIYGGIIGAIWEMFFAYRENKRLSELMNTPIYNGLTYSEYMVHLIKVVSELVQKQVEVQKQATENDDCYFGNVTLIVDSVDAAHSAWYGYSPELAMVEIKLENEETALLGQCLEAYIKEEFGKMRFPETISDVSEEPKSRGGCFWLFLVSLVKKLFK